MGQDVPALVEPCDREAAIKAGEEALRNIRSLKDYDHEAMVRHFAKHRIAATEHLQAELDRLKEALRFYATPFNYRRSSMFINSTAYSAIDRDEGANSA